MTRGTWPILAWSLWAWQLRVKEGAQLYGMASQLGAAAWMAKYGRDDELESDHYGMNYMASAGYDVQGAVELQEKFVELSKSRQAGFWIIYLPATRHQLRESTENQARAANFASGKRYRARYQAAIAQLKKDRPPIKPRQRRKKHWLKRMGVWLFNIWTKP